MSISRLFHPATSIKKFIEKLKFYEEELESAKSDIKDFRHFLAENAVLIKQKNAAIEKAINDVLRAAIWSGDLKRVDALLKYDINLDGILHRVVYYFYHKLILFSGRGGLCEESERDFYQQLDKEFSLILIRVAMEKNLDKNLTDNYHDMDMTAADLAAYHGLKTFVDILENWGSKITIDKYYLSNEMKEHLNRKDNSLRV